MWGLYRINCSLQEIHHRGSTIAQEPGQLVSHLHMGTYAAFIIKWEGGNYQLSSRKYELVKSNLILFVTYTWLEDVNVSVAKRLCF